MEYFLGILLLLSAIYHYDTNRKLIKAKSQNKLLLDQCEQLIDLIQSSQAHTERAIGVAVDYEAMVKRITGITGIAKNEH